MSDLQLFTGRFHDHDRERHGVAIRTSLGAPRWRLSYAIAGALPMLTPRRAYLHAPSLEFEATYLGQLDDHGIDRVLQAIADIADEAGATSASLLCFEADAAKCHRALLGNWLTSHGLEVVEVTTGRPWSVEAS